MIDLSGISTILAGKKARYPQHVNRLSSLDDPCERRLYYRRREWDKAETADDSLQGIFETGNILEGPVGRILAEVGERASPPWRIVGNQNPTDDALLRKYQISGSIDGLLQVDQRFTGERLGDRWHTDSVCDIKTMSPHVHASINSYEDLGKYPWTRGYRGQLMGYALAFGLEWCIIMAVNKSNLYDIKAIEFPLDMAYMEELLQKAARVNDCVAQAMPPPGVNDPKICPRCDWFSFCCPSYSTGGNLEMVDNEELEAILERLSALDGSAMEYAELEKQRDRLLTDGKDWQVGRFLIQWKKISGNRKPSEGGEFSYYKKSISAL